MKKFIYIFLGLIIGASALTVNAQLRVLTVPQGGTGASTLTGCLKGNGTGAITGTGVDCVTSGSSFPFTPTSWGVSTSTTLGFLNGFLSTASSTQIGLFRIYNGESSVADATNDLILEDDDDIIVDFQGIDNGFFILDYNTPTAGRNGYFRYDAGATPAYRWNVGNVDELNLNGTRLGPISNDGLALGLGTIAFSDLFLASGGVINWNNGDVNLTHSSGNLTLSSGDIFNASDSIVTRSTTTQATTTNFYNSTATNLSNSLYINSSGGNVGVGSTSPSSLLTVHGGDIAIGHDNFLQFDGGYTGNAISSTIFSGSTRSLDFQVNNDTRMVINSTGNVGIGTTTPYASLSVVGPVVSEYVHATSTTASSTFAGGVHFGSNVGKLNQVSFTAPSGITFPSSNSTGGYINMNCTNITAGCLQQYSNAGAGRTQDINFFFNDNVFNDQRLLSLRQDGVRNGLLVNGTNATSRLAGQELVAFTDFTGATTTTLGISGAPVGVGLQKNLVNSGADANASALSIQLDDTDVQGIFADTVTSYTGKLLNLRIDGSEKLVLDSNGVQFKHSSTTLQNFTAVNSTSSSATTTNFHISGNLNFNGVSGSTWASFCTTITGGAGLCDGSDDGGAGAGTGETWKLLSDINFLAPTTTKSIAIGATTTPSLDKSALFQVNATGTTGTLIKASSTASFAGNFLRFTNSAGTMLTNVDSSGGLQAYASSTIGGGSTTNGLTVNGRATTTSLAISDNIISRHSAGFLDFQRSGADFTLLRVRAPNGDSNEATLSLVVDLDSPDAGVNEEYVDFYNERYSDSKQWGIRQAYSGTGIPKPFALGHWNTAGSKDDGNKLIILPSGTVAVAKATSTVDQTAAFEVSSSTATYVLRANDSGPEDTSPFVIDTSGNTGIGTTSPYTKLSVVGETVSAYFTATTTTQSTFPRFTSTLSTTTSATTTNLHVSGRSITVWGNSTHITGTTTKSFNIASTTMGVAGLGNGFKTGTTTLWLMTHPEPVIARGVYCTASSSGVALLRFGDQGGNYTNSITPDTGSTRTYQALTTNNTWTAGEDFTVQASSTSGVVERINCSVIFNTTGT